jgi:glycosyltransferase involved in cell wall biosynthesis
MPETKVLLIQNILALYNLPIYNLLGKSPGISLTVAHYDTSVTREEKFFHEIVWHFCKAGSLLISKENIKEICNEYDVVICLADIHWLSHIMLGLRIKRKFKLIYWGIGVSASYKKKFDEEKRWDFIRFFFMKRADALIFYSSYPVQKYVKHGFRKETLFVANNTIQVNFKPLVTSEKDLILFVGTLYKEKGIFELLSAYDEAYRETSDLPDLFIIGSGEEYINIRNWISQNKLDEKITLQGAVYDDVILGQFFSRAIACISPNQAGLAVLQSMGSGVPFITRSDSLTGGERFNIKNNETGLIYYQKKELVNILCGINKNKEFFKLMGSNARKFYESCCRPDQMAKGFLDAIVFVLNNKK